MSQLKNVRWLILAVVFFVLAFAPLWGSRYFLLLLLLFYMYMSFSQMWNLLAGYSGLLSLGQQAFIGFGGYTMAVLTSYYGVNTWLAVIGGGLFSVLLALIMSLFIFRMKGIFFAIGTWIFAEALMMWFSNWEYVNLGTGLFIKPDPPVNMTMIYYAAFAIAVLSIAVVYAILRSRIGLGLMAMRDDEEVSETMGVGVFRSKLFCFLVAAFFTGATASVFYLFQVFIQPYSAFAIDWTIIFTFIVIIGGIGTVEGPIVGSLLYVLLSQYLSEYGSISMIVLGALAITVILLSPQGIMGNFRRITGLEILSPRRS